MSEVYKSCAGRDNTRLIARSLVTYEVTRTYQYVYLLVGMYRSLRKKRKPQFNGESNRVDVSFRNALMGRVKQDYH